MLAYNKEERGVGIELGFRADDGSGYSNFRWIQTVQTNAPVYSKVGQYLDPAGGPYKDDLPFVFPNRILPDYQNKDGFNLIFEDHPDRLHQSHAVYWKAELSLVGRQGGHYHPLSTVNYGFDLRNNEVRVAPIVPTTPSPFQLSFIK